MKDVEIKDSLKAVKGIHGAAPGEPIRVTDQGKVVAYILPASQYNGGDVDILTDPAFWQMMRESCKSDEGITLDVAMRRLEAREAREKQGGRRARRPARASGKRLKASKAKSFK
jgi:antitoxin (DNA-binding transcriptional repressor) of toxin-antitoxin stability system